jgi:hypothetical protein
MTGNPSDPAALARHLTSPVENSAQSDRAAPLYGADFCREFDIRIARDGTWFYHGSPITRKPLVKLFASVLRRDEHGEYWLQTPAEKGRIHVDDVPFTAVEVSSSGSGREQNLTFRTNLDEFVTAGPQHHIRVIEDRSTGTPRPYVNIRDRLDALIARPVFYDLVELAEEARGPPPQLGVWSGGMFFTLGRLA